MFIFYGPSDNDLEEKQGPHSDKTSVTLVHFLLPSSLKGLSRARFKCIFARADLTFQDLSTVPVACGRSPSPGATVAVRSMINDGLSMGEEDGSPAVSETHQHPRLCSVPRRNDLLLAGRPGPSPPGVVSIPTMAAICIYHTLG